MSRPDWLTGNLQGALWIILSCLAGTLMSAGIKGLEGGVHTLQVTFLRCVVSLILILPFVLQQHRREQAEGRAGPLTRLSPRWRLHLIRGLLATVAINCGYFAISQIPLATVTVIFFTAPLFITLLAVPMLGERVGWRRWSATSVGFLGALIVLRPGTAEFDPVMLFAVLSSVLFATSLLIGKRLSRSEPPSTILLYTTVITVIGSLPLAIYAWVDPDWNQLLLIAVVSVFATARSYTDIKGYAVGEASFVAPFSYFRLLFMGLAGYLLFAEVPQQSALVGAVFIIGASLYIAQREAVHKRQLSRPAAGPGPGAD